MKKMRCLVCLFLVTAFLTGCSILPGATEPPTTFAPDPEHTLQEYTQWIGLPVSRAIHGLELSGVKAVKEERIATNQSVTYLDNAFDLTLLALKDFDYSFGGVELNTKFVGDTDETAAAVWKILDGIDKEYINVEAFQQNMFLESMECSIFSDLPDESTFFKSVDYALKIHGQYSASVSWDITRLASTKTEELLELMKPSVLAAIEDAYKGKDYIWCADERLVVEAQVTIYDTGSAAMTVTCRAAVDPAASYSEELKPKDRHTKYVEDAYSEFVSQKSLYVTGYEFITTDNEVNTLYEELYLCGEDYVSVVNNGVMKTILLCMDGKQYTAISQNGVCGKWEPVAQPVEHPFLQVKVAEETSTSRGGSFYGGRGRKQIGCTTLHLDNSIITLYYKNNMVWCIENRTTETEFMGTDNLVTYRRKIMEIEKITEEEATSVLNEYKAMLS